MSYIGTLDLEEVSNQLKAAAPVRGKRVASPGGRRLRVLLGLLHRLVVRPATFHLSSAVIRRRVRKAAGSSATVLDASVGDDRLLLDLARGRQAVANDIEIVPGVQKPFRRAGVQLTRGDLPALPFRSKSFDCAVAKNVFHHLRSRTEQRFALAELSRVATKVIVVDIQHPHTSLLAYLFNRWYRAMGDDGECFLRETEFKSLVLEQFPLEIVRFERIRTVKGPFMMAVVDSGRMPCSKKMNS